ncbi:hypothetical protein GGF43_006029 [Coemansia sp. RSA 2618]|nr:hypothetical protein GGF43_006029 [Coemansia sp. RSA 2618]
MDADSDVARGAGRPGQNRRALRAAENDVLQHAGLLDGETHSRDSKHKALLRPRRWRRSGAIAVTSVLAWVIRYPLHTATMFMQFSGVDQYPAMFTTANQNPPVFKASQHPSVFSGVIRYQTPIQQPTAIFTHFNAGLCALGAVYERSSNWHLHAAGLAAGLVAPESTTLVRMASSVALHYMTYAAMYGLLRQSVAARLLSLSSDTRVIDVVRPAIAWVRDLLMLRGPRGAVFPLYVRDVASSVVSGALAMVFTRMFTSRRAVSVYRGVVRADMAWRRVANLALRRMGLVLAQSTFRASGVRAEAAVEASAGASAAFATVEDQLVQMHDSGGSDDSGDELPVAGLADRQALRRVEFLAYTRAVGAMLGAVAARAALYPVDSVLVRLMADEAGLTAHAYSGFFDCLARVCRSAGASALYAGFPVAVAADLALTWLSAEAMHYLCKTAWIQF